jgi:enoyl-CoA hydratase
MNVRVETEGPVTIVTIDRPERRNAVDPATAEALRDAFESFESDGGQAVAVLTGSGGHFCAGFDLEAVAEAAARHDPDGPGPMGPTRLALTKPVVAAVEGYAVAGGLELALWCDLRVSSESARFGVFCRRWGVPLIDGGTVRLPRLIGQSRALDMILTGREVAAAEAMDWGLANRLVAVGAARRAAVALAAEIAAFPQICLRADRDSALAQWSLPLAEALAGEARGGVAPLQREARAGAARFVAGSGRGGAFEPG